MNKRPLVLAILDGFGISNINFGNAPLEANMQNIKTIHQNYPWTLLNASGESVGLTKDAYGTCEAGHLNIGAGRLVDSVLSILNKKVEDHSLLSNEAILKAIEVAKQRNKKYLHLVVLVSNSPTLGYQNLTFSLIKLISEHDLIPVVHAISDGKDVKKKSAALYFGNLVNTLNQYKGILADISGRYYALDTTAHWNRVLKAWNVMSKHDGDSFDSYEWYIENQYSLSQTDEFFTPAYNLNYQDTNITDDDVVIMTPLRSRFSKELASLITNSVYDTFSSEDYEPKNNIYFVSTIPYKNIKTNDTILKIGFLTECLGEVLAKNNIKQLRVCENDTFDNMTYFLDGGIDKTFANETIMNFPSLDVTTYDVKPEMNALKITQYVLDHVQEYDVVMVSYANPDLLGHTGNLKATTKGLKIIDLCIGSLYEKVVNELNGCLMITSDHGNCEQMLDENENPITYHSSFKVPFILTERKLHLVSDGGSLSDIAPTILDYLNITKPAVMTGKSLLKPATTLQRINEKLKRDKVSLDIKTLNDQEVAKILGVDNASDDEIKYQDENDFSALEI